MERRFGSRARRGNYSGRLRGPVSQHSHRDRQAVLSPRNLDGALPIRQPTLTQGAQHRSDRDPSTDTSYSARTAHTPKTTTIIDWRHEICHFLQLDPDATDKEVFDELQIASAKLKEAERAKNQTTIQQGPLRCQVIHRVSCAATGERLMYIEEPWTVHTGPYRSHLRGSEQVSNMELYLERNKDVSFLVLRDYLCCAEKSHSSTRPRFGKDTDTMLVQEQIEIVSDKLRSKLAGLSNAVLQGIPHPKFGRVEDDEDDIDNNYEDESKSSDNSDDNNSGIYYPYIWFYYRRRVIAEAIKYLEETHQEHLNVFCGYIQDRMSDEWDAVDNLISKGEITAEHIRYIYIPGDIIVSTPQGSAKTKLQAYVITNWVEVFSTSSDTFSASVPTASWSFDGKFQRNEYSLPIGHVPSLSHAFQICALNPHPMEFSDENIEITQSLRERGKMFWRCRGRNYVCYKSFVDDGMRTATDSRFMIDTKTLQQMHPNEHKATNCDDLGTEVLSKVDPPLEDEFILCLPPTIVGFNMQKKEWVTLDVDLIEDVVWNTDAFKFLVIEDRMKELVQAVVTNQIHAAESTDLIRGKGSGLTMLLHGGPGTGKTLTAESVAEVAKKPLYRVTCGDIGTKAEEVEKYLETIFLLGKTWDCVVLLDEADVFLEQRSLVNLDRNALVSGILILTSNRVGIFDEAFKSRIQLNLRYQNLNRGQRLEIWRNFISRLERLAGGDSRGGLEIDAEDILSHIDNLAKPELNGREIRNAISTARQLARYRKQPLGYKHLQSVIAEAEKFDQYLKDLHEGFSADERQNDKGER
ncbi:hypothetical protein LA080_004746 [Diaporthe eres]|nr:hypothetical protein LA080_004746 [Diaporthe eres]